MRNPWMSLWLSAANSWTEMQGCGGATAGIYPGSKTGTAS
jgi:hypothetical protein